MEAQSFTVEYADGKKFGKAPYTVEIPSDARYSFYVRLGNSDHCAVVFPGQPIAQHVGSLSHLPHIFNCLPHAKEKAEKAIA